MAKKADTVHLESVVAMLRVSLEWYGAGNKDDGERARLVVESTTSGQAMLAEMKLLREQVATVNKEAAQLRERVAELEHGEAEELKAWRAAAQKYERWARECHGWIADRYATNDLHDAAEKHERWTRELTAARSSGFVAVLADPLSWFRCRSGRPQQSLIHATCKLSRDEKGRTVLSLLHPGPIPNRSHLRR